MRIGNLEYIAPPRIERNWDREAFCFLFEGMKPTARDAHLFFLFGWVRCTYMAVSRESGELGGAGWTGMGMSRFDLA
jgi:hypothetical protein